MVIVFRRLFVVEFRTTAFKETVGGLSRLLDRALTHLMPADFYVHYGIEDS